MDMMYGVSVVFPDGEFWSRRYTYLSPEPVETGKLVVVPYFAWYKVGKVVECIIDPTLDPNVKYKFIKFTE